MNDSIRQHQTYNMVGNWKKKYTERHYGKITFSQSGKEITKYISEQSIRKNIENDADGVDVMLRTNKGSEKVRN